MPPSKAFMMMPRISAVHTCRNKKHRVVSGKTHEVIEEDIGCLTWEDMGSLMLAQHVVSQGCRAVMQ